MLLLPLRFHYHARATLRWVRHVFTEVTPLLATLIPLPQRIHCCLLHCYDTHISHCHTIRHCAIADTLAYRCRFHYAMNGRYAAAELGHYAITLMPVVYASHEETYAITTATHCHC